MLMERELSIYRASTFHRDRIEQSAMKSQMHITTVYFFSSSADATGVPGMYKTFIRQLIV